jgi:hypothetical protein
VQRAQWHDLDAAIAQRAIPASKSL